jgi:hypothetical protein
MTMTSPPMACERRSPSRRGPAPQHAPSTSSPGAGSSSAACGSACRACCQPRPARSQSTSRRGWPAVRSPPASSSWCACASRPAAQAARHEPRSAVPVDMNLPPDDTFPSYRLSFAPAGRAGAREWHAGRAARRPRALRRRPGGAGRARRHDRRRRGRGAAAGEAEPRAGGGGGGDAGPRPGGVYIRVGTPVGGPARAQRAHARLGYNIRLSPQ